MGSLVVTLMFFSISFFFVKIDIKALKILIIIFFKFISEENKKKAVVKNSKVKSEYLLLIHGIKLLINSY